MGENSRPFSTFRERFVSFRSKKRKKRSPIRPSPPQNGSWVRKGGIFPGILEIQTTIYLIRSMQTPEDLKAQIVQKLDGAPLRRYPHPLPEELRRWHGFFPAFGHCLLIVLSSQHSSKKKTIGDLTPVPVRAVLHYGYSIRNGFIVSDLPYDKNFGVGNRYDEY
jgi:hypothetical protein